MANANIIGPATKINGSIETEEDLTVEGRVEGGPVRVRGRLHVAARGILLAEETEVTEALIVGVFVGTLRASEVVRIHQDGRIVGDVIAPRVVFVSDKPASSHDRDARTTDRAATVSGAHERSRSGAHSLPPPAPRPRLEEPVADASQLAHAAPVQAQHAEGTESSGQRAIPVLPGLGQRAMQRKE